MRYLFGFICVCALGVVPLVGCGETSGDGGSGGSGGTAGTGGSAGAGGTGGMPEVRMYLFSIDELNPDGTTPPLEGVNVCQADTDNCFTSNELGRAALAVPFNQEIMFTFEKEGYGSRIFADVSDETFGPNANGDGAVTGVRMYPDDQLAAIAGQLGTPYPWDGGMVGLTGWPAQTAGVTFTPVGSTIDAVGELFYFDAATEQYSPDLDATTAFPAPWRFPLAAGGFTEVTPGEQQFAFGGTADCSRPSYAWPGDAPNTIRIPVREGYMSYGSIVCDEP